MGWWRAPLKIRSEQILHGKYEPFLCKGYRNIIMVSLLTVSTKGNSNHQERVSWWNS